jgi:hypothetical protein
MTSRFLTTNFENTQSLIETNPQNEDTIINDYINMIIENKNNSRFVRSATYRDSGGINNMPNIKIMNNFQRYGPDGYEQPIFIPTTTATIVSTSNLANAPPVSLTGAGTGGNVGLGTTSAPPPLLAGGNVGLGTTSAPPPLLAGGNVGLGTTSAPPPLLAGGNVGLGTTSAPPPLLAGGNVGLGTTSAPPPLLAGGNVGLGTTSAPPPQSFRNRETFQNYYNNYINGGFKEYYHI